MSTRPPQIKSLKSLAVKAAVARWHPSLTLQGCPQDVAQLLWAELKAWHTREGTPLPCSAMYPFVRFVWTADAIDLSDSGKWLTNGSGYSTRR